MFRSDKYIFWELRPTSARDMHRYKVSSVRRLSSGLGVDTMSQTEIRTYMTSTQDGPL
jgi:hypothetical protein